MKIIFLDFDGVLNSLWFFFHALRKARDHAIITDPDTELDPKAVKYLNDLVAVSGAKVVISSSWRLVYPIGRLIQVLEGAGFKGEVIDVTPFLRGERRGMEIGAWLGEHPEVESFVILDDKSDMGWLSHRLVQTDAGKGLKSKHVMAALQMLGIERTEAA